MRLAVVVLALFMSSGPHAVLAPPPDEGMKGLLAQIGEKEWVVGRVLLDKDAAHFQIIDPDDLIWQVAKNGGSFSDVVDAFKKEYSLTSAVAEPLARGWIRAQASWADSDSPYSEAIFEDLHRAVLLSEGAFLPTLAATRFSHYTESARHTRMFETLVSQLPTLPQTLATIASAWLESEVMLIALEADPSVLMPMVTADFEWGEPALLPSYDVALQKLLNSDAPASDQTVADIAYQKLNVLLHSGLSELAVEALEALPANVRKLLGSRLSLRLSAAYLIEGNRAEAARLLDANETPRSDPETMEKALLIDAALHPERDPFEVLVRYGSHEPLWDQVTFLVGAPYPELLARHFRQWRSLHSGDPSEDLSPRVARATSDFNQARKKRRDSIRATEARLLESTKNTSGSTLPTLTHLLREPPQPACRLVPFEQSNTAWKRWGGRPPDTQGLEVAAASENGSRRVVIFKTSPWSVVRSEDAGKTWSPKVFLGLLPLETTETLRWGFIPWVDGDTLYLDPRVPTNRTARVVHAPEPPKRYVSCSLSELEQDTDGDGLTDVFEAWLLTDPNLRDTDGDGLADAVDPMPHVPRQGKPTLKAQATLHALSFKPRATKFIENLNPPSGPEKLKVDAGTTFLVGERDEFRGLTPRRRVVVLSPTEAEQYEKHWGRPFRHEHLQVVTNHAGTMVHVDNDERFARIEYFLKKESDGWHVFVLSQSWTCF